MNNITYRPYFPVQNPYMMAQPVQPIQPNYYAFQPSPVYKPNMAWSQPAQQWVVDNNLRNNNILQNYYNAVTPQVYPAAQPAPEQKSVYKNDLRELFHNNNAKIYAMVPRTFNAKDKNGNGLIDNGEESGTFLNAIERLDELKSLGINTLHLLPIHPPGKKGAMGTAGSVYAPLSYLLVDPKLDDPNNNTDVKAEAKKFVEECHKRGIRVMLDLPSCASVDLYEEHPELMAIDSRGNPKVPQGWQDIRMFRPWADQEKKALNEHLLDMHKKFVDLTMELGMDGIRADVARGKPVEFWDKLIGYARSKDPNFAFLAESYTYEDASPIANIPADRPEDLLRVGFDSYYGQYHIFNQMRTAKDFHDNMTLNLEMSRNLPPNKSLIGSFATHDDKSPMTNGGVPYCNLTTGLQATLPMTNPYFVTGFESGDRYVYSYKDQTQQDTDTDNHKCIVHPEMLDIFNYSRKPGGNHPEIGRFMSKMFKLRDQYQDVITKGSYIPLEVKGNKEDQIIAFARHLNGKTLLIIANKDVNARQSGSVVVPTLRASQQLINMAPPEGVPSKYDSKDGAISVDLGPARFHMFEINTPAIEKNSPKVYLQNLIPNLISEQPKNTPEQNALNFYLRMKSKNY